MRDIHSPNRYSEEASLAQGLLVVSAPTEGFVDNVVGFDGRSLSLGPLKMVDRECSGLERFFLRQRREEVVDQVVLLRGSEDRGLEVGVRYLPPSSQAIGTSYISPDIRLREKTMKRRVALLSSLEGQIARNRST